MVNSNRHIRAQFEDAKRELARQADLPPDPDPHLPRDGVQPGAWPGAPFEQMPPDCPVKVHGLNGSIIWVSDANGQLVALERDDGSTLVRLFGVHQNYIAWAFPRWAAEKKDKDGKPLPPRINGIEYRRLYQCLVAESGRRGMFDPERQHQGRGGWLDGERNFVWHSGEALWTIRSGKLVCSQPGLHMEKLYTVQYDILTPWQEKVDPDESPALRIFEDFKTWSWDRHVLDPILLVGWMVTALMGGALDWRPIIFTTGGAGVGKSTLHGILRSVLDSAVMASSDTTAAGIRQTVQRDSTGVIVDEFEGGAKNRSKRQPVLDLARIAASGDDAFRGSSDHAAQKFTVRCSFFFSAIRVPQLETSDKSRMAILNLSKLEGGDTGREFVYSADDGRKLLRQVMENFKDFDQRILPGWKETLAQARFNMRAIDTYATLLAAAELVLGHEVMLEHGLPMDSDTAVGEMLAEMTRTERDEQKEEWLQCLEHLLSSTIEGWKGGERPTVGGCIEVLEKGTGASTVENHEEFRVRRSMLNQAGLSIKKPKAMGWNDGYVLCVPPSGQGLEKLFAGSDWEGGGWTGSLKQGPTDIVQRGSTNAFAVSINRVTHKCLYIDLKAFDAWQPKPAREID